MRCTGECPSGKGSNDRVKTNASFDVLWLWQVDTKEVMVTNDQTVAVCQVPGCLRLNFVAVDVDHGLVLDCHLQLVFLVHLGAVENAVLWQHERPAELHISVFAVANAGVP